MGFFFVQRTAIQTFANHIRSSVIPLSIQQPRHGLGRKG